MKLKMLDVQSALKNGKSKIKYILTDKKSWINSYMCSA